MTTCIRSLAAKDEEIAKLKESVHEQRIRVLDIKYELREVGGA